MAFVQLMDRMKVLLRTQMSVSTIQRLLVEYETNELMIRCKGKGKGKRGFV